MGTRAKAVADLRLAGAGDMTGIAGMAVRSAFIPCRYLKGFGGNPGDLWLEQIRSKLDGGSRTIILEERGVIKGFAVLEDLPWDSAVFEKRMGIIWCLELDPEVSPGDGRGFSSFIIETAAKDGYEFLLAKAHTDNVRTVHLLEGCGFMLVDTLLDYVWDREGSPATGLPAAAGIDGLELGEACPGDEEKLRQVGGKAFLHHFGRYHSDPRIPRDLACGFYREWVSASLKGYADHFVVARIKGEIAGYSIWKKQANLEKRHGLSLGHYSIAGIDPGFSGRGLFSVLTMKGMSLLRDEVRFIEGPTHINNYPVQRGYAKLGWKIADARHSFHKWLGE